MQAEGRAGDRSGPGGPGHGRILGIPRARAVLSLTFFTYNPGQRGRGSDLGPPHQAAAVAREPSLTARTPRSPKREQSLRAGPRMQVTQELGQPRGALGETAGQRRGHVNKTRRWQRAPGSGSQRDNVPQRGDGNSREPGGGCMAALCTMRATIPKFKIRKDFNLKVQGRRGNSAPGLMRLQTGGCGNSTAGSLEEDESA